MILETMNTYAQACLDGTIPVCKLVKFACKRHFADLERDDIYFDETAADRVVKFIGLMVHVKGHLAGQRLKLEPWQIFFVGSVFGWKRKDTGMRRYREANLTIPRKSGKSLIANAIAHYMLVADKENGGEVILAAAKEAQAKDLFFVALQMVNMNKEYSKFYGLKTTTETIRHPKSGSFFKFVVGTPTDGGNPSCIIIDEYHEHKSSAAYDALKLGVGARQQPLLLVVSTAGVDYKCAYKRYLEYCEKVVSGVIEDDTLFMLEYTIDEDDDWQDFGVWEKANPNMGVSVSEEFLRAQHARAMSDISNRSAILTKHLDVWNNSSSAWIDFPKWLECGDSSLKMSDFEGEECWLGLDLASRVDLCSLTIVFKRDEKFYLFGKHYLNSERVHKPENQHLQVYADEGWLTVTDGAQTDFTAIANDIQEIASKHLVQSLSYDPREATFLMQQVREWANFPCIEMPQSPANISEPMKVLESLYLSQNLVHQNDSVMNWAASNVILKNSSNKLFYPAKRTNEEKIDPIVSAIMALAQAETASQSYDFSIFTI